MATSRKDQIRAEILALKRRGVVKAEAVYEWAENNPGSAIYKSLEWDDAKAGVLYRIHQIRTMMTLYIVDESGEPELVSLSVDRTTPGGGYRVLEDVKNVPAMREVLIVDVLVALERLAHRYADLTELRDVWNAIAEARAAYDLRHSGAGRGGHDGDHPSPTA